MQNTSHEQRILVNNHHMMILVSQARWCSGARPPDLSEIYTTIYLSIYIYHL